MKGPQFALVLTGVLLNAIAQLLLKAGAGSLANVELRASNAAMIASRVIFNVPIIAGLACYALSVVVWILALSRVEVSVAYPMLSIGYVVNALAAWWLFGESLSGARWPASASSSSASGWWRAAAAERAASMPSNDFLPFTRPSIDEATIAAVGDVLRSGWITSGPKVRAFEAQLSQLFGGRPVRTVSSATGAMEIALALAGIGPGDEVITTPLSWVATANVVLRAGARRCSSIAIRARATSISTRVEAAITPRTRALLPVDLAGLPVDRDRLYAIARAHKLRVIEDAAQSMGANWAGRMIGASGDLVSISFHANKNITTAEGGCLVLNDEDEARRCELWRLQGVERSGRRWDGMDVTLAGGKHN